MARGKHYLAKRILALAPKHIHYVEPYFGGGQLLLAKDPNEVSEVVNDIHGGLTNFWRVLQGKDTFADFQRIVEAMPFSQIEYRDAKAKLGDGDPIEQAVHFFVAARQSLAGRMNGFTGITKTRTRRGMNNEVSAWLSSIEGLPAVHARLSRVLILEGEALDVIRSQDGPETWFYLDPTYLKDTRTAPDVYAHEMTKQQHGKLLQVLSRIKGKFALSGYRSNLYDEAAKRFGWTRTDFSIPNHSAGGATKRRMVECLWQNY